MCEEENFKERGERREEEEEEEEEEGKYYGNDHSLFCALVENTFSLSVWYRRMIDECTKISIVTCI
jgi:hypothetical protein